LRIAHGRGSVSEPRDLEKTARRFKTSGTMTIQPIMTFSEMKGTSIFRR
jgi:hypothetical protein